MPETHPTPTRRPADVLCVGEAMAMVVPHRPEPLEHATEFRIEVGGAESNVAAHLARAGRAAAWFGAVGDDALGRRVVAQLAGYGVDTTRVLVDPDAPTGLYVKDPGVGVTYYRRGSAASRLGREHVHDLDWGTVGLVHLSGVSLALSSTHADLVDSIIQEAHEHGVRVGFDVNHRPALWDPSTCAADVLARAASRADVVWVGRDEAETLWGTTDAADVRGLLPHVPHLIVKDADVAATEFGAGTETVVPAPRVDVVESIGAGDAFAAGWLDASLDGRDAPSRLQRGHEFAARALSSTADIPRPRRDHRREGATP